MQPIREKRVGTSAGGGRVGERSSPGRSPPVEFVDQERDRDTRGPYQKLDPIPLLALFLPTRAKPRVDRLVE